MRIKAKIIKEDNDKIPNETTLKAIKEVYDGKVIKSKNAIDLIKKMKQ